MTPDVGAPVEDIPRIAGTVGPDEGGILDDRRTGEMSILSLVGAGLPPPLDAAESLALGEISMRGEAVTVAAGDQVVTVPS